MNCLGISNTFNSHSIQNKMLQKLSHYDKEAIHGMICIEKARFQRKFGIRKREMDE